MLLVGLLPSKILDLTSAALDDADPSSSRTCSSVFPKASALKWVSILLFPDGLAVLGLLGLGKEVGEEDLVMLAARDGVEGLDRGEEITAGQSWIHNSKDRKNIPWDKLGTLVDELVEGMLTVGSALSPDDWLYCVSSSPSVGSKKLTPVS